MPVVLEVAELLLEGRTQESSDILQLLTSRDKNLLAMRVQNMSFGIKNGVLLVLRVIIRNA